MTTTDDGGTAGGAAHPADAPASNAAVMRPRKAKTVLAMHGDVGLCYDETSNPRAGQASRHTSPTAAVHDRARLIPAGASDDSSFKDIVIPGEGPESTPFFVYVDVKKAWMPGLRPA
ncbi:MAG TPA: hypothetical protein VJY39_14745 [Acidisphaera sp.]|nr:hypothetical protein [Acidisphaera sp.]